MKPTRPPIRAIGNAIVLQPQNFDPRMQRNASTNNTLNEQKPLIRQYSQQAHQEQPHYIYTNQRQQLQSTYQRGHSPTIIQRPPMQETTHFYNNIQNNIEQQPQLHKIPHQGKPQPLDISIKQSYIINKQLSPKQCENNQKMDQRDMIIKQQNDQIVILQQSLSERVHLYQQLQEKFNDEFKKFQEDFHLQLNSLELNIQMNDYTQLFMNDIDRKVINLQNNINDQIKELLATFEQRQQQTEHLAKNLQANTAIRISEDEAYFKGEFDIIKQKIQSKMDQGKAELLINNQLNLIQSQYQNQLQTAQNLLNKINSDKTDELKQIKIHIQNTLQQLNQEVSQQLQHMYQMVSDNTQDSQQIKQERKTISQQFNQLNVKFQNLQQQFIDKQSQWKQKINNLEQENYELTNKYEQAQQLIKKQQKELEKLASQNMLITHASPVTNKMSPQANKQNSFFSNSTNAGNFTKSRRNRITSITQQNLSKKQRQREISLDDFADFNENSLNDSSESLDINQTCGFYNNSKTNNLLTSNQFSSPPRSIFQQSQLININQMLLSCEEKEKPKLGSRSKSAIPSKMGQLEKAIQRRLLLQGKTGKSLLCTYSPGQHLADANMGIYLLDENDEPFTVSEQDVESLIERKIIKIIQQ